MAQETDVTRGGDGQQEFWDKWEAWDEPTRVEHVKSLRSQVSAFDKNNTKHAQQLKELEGERDALRDELAVERAKKVTSLEGLQEQIATVKAERELLRKQSQMIERAVTGKIDPALAIHFAKSDDPNSAFNLLESEISRKVQEGINQKLLDSETFIPSGEHERGPLKWSDMLRMSQEELARIPDALKEKALREAVNNG